MLISLAHNLTYLANPKTGSTAVEMALRSRCEIIFRGNRKHLTAQRYYNRVAPFLQDTFSARPETVAVMRHPVDHIKSWFRYRSAPRLDGTPLSTDGMDFDAFVLAVISTDPPPCAAIGSQFAFLTSEDGALLVQHLFAYEAQPTFRNFLSERFEMDVALKPKNVSPRAETRLSPQVELRLRASRAQEFALYHRLKSNGGCLSTV